MEIKNTKGLHTEKVKLLIYGNAGVGKTSLIGTLPENAHTVIVSAEAGLLCLSDKEIDVIEVKKWDDVGRAFVFLRDECNYDYIAIDSLTELSDMLVNHLEQQPEFKDPKNTLKMWGEFNKRLTSFIKSVRGLDTNVIFTALTDEVDDGGSKVRKALVKGSATQKLLASYFDEVFYLTIDQITGERTIQTQPTAYIEAKDRSGKLEAYEEPNLTNIINKIKGA